MRKYDILDLLKFLEQKSDKIKEVFDCGDFLDQEISIVWAMISADYENENTDWKISDKITDILYKFGRGKISKNSAKKQLKSLSYPSNPSISK